MSARKPLVPAELRELLSLMHEVSEPLPMPAAGPDGLSADGAWQARAEREIHRHSMLRARLFTLVTELEIGDKYPSVAAESLARICARDSEAIRAELARPLGYEPQPEKEMEAQ